ncbi:MAG: response regulator transcription factor [Saprospiraceae bacterium]|nr:response regulator transcription factor [Saprospiraceae bacterium]MCB0679112.1 response regulator transcription factor [Saprospiraceae bacterium]MCB0680786.1 response regulator transcription factor [Saprospiraceae bacterium]
MIKAVIIEDEALIARELQAKIAAVADDVKIVETLPSLKTARKWLLQNAEPDLLFMDIQLSDGVSFELFEDFDLHCPVIFTTAYDEYALRAFKVNGIDYLLKPIDSEALAAAIQKYRRQAESQPKPPTNWQELLKTLQQAPDAGQTYKEKFVVSVRNTWVPVNTSDIACILRDNLNYLHTFDGGKYMLDYNTLEEVEELLDPKQFYRANRQSIVNIENIQSVKPHENQKLTLHLKAPAKMSVDISRDKAPAFKRWFDR